MSPPRRSPRLLRETAAVPAPADKDAALDLAPPEAKAPVPATTESSGLQTEDLITYLAPLVMIAAGCLHAIIQEQLMHELGHFPLLITASDFGCCSGLSLLLLTVRGESTREAPRLKLLRISVLVLASLVSGNVALKWVSYPIKVVVKSCKLLPTMALGGLLLGKRYSKHEQLAAVLLCAGLVGFTLAEKSGKAAGRPSSPIGVGVLLFAVSCDAVHVLLAERMLKASPQLTGWCVMLHTNGYAFLAVLAAMFATGEAARTPWATLPWHKLAVYGASSWVGVCCFVRLTRTWGGSAAVVATNARKLLTVGLSFILFPKPLSLTSALAGVAVVAGIAVKSASKKDKGEKRE